MLLRSITKHVTNQNWFAVWIDFTIVVIGVFIGIQVANWNDDRNLAIQEQQVLNAILEGLKSDSAILADSISMAQYNLNATNYSLKAADLDEIGEMVLPVGNTLLNGLIEYDALPNSNISDTEKLALWKYITIHYYPAQSDAALSTLIAAGNLGLIRDAKLRHDLQQYKLIWHALEESNIHTFRPFRDRVVFIGQRFGLSPFGNFGEEKIVDFFKQSPELVGSVRTLAEFTRLHLRQMENVAEQTQTLIGQIEKLLAQQPIFTKSTQN